MGRVAKVIEVEADGGVRCDLGGEDMVTAEGFAGAGEDCPPLPGDDVALSEGVGAGGYQVTGYHDETAKTAQGGEKRLYARDSGGALMAEIHIKGDGSVDVTSLASGGAKLTVKADGTILLAGNVEITGDLTVGGDAAVDGDVDATNVTGSSEVTVGALALSTHVHTGVTSGMGVSGSPTGPP